MKRFVVLLLCSYLFAGPPMKSNDPFVPSLHEFEINIAVEAEKKEEKLKRLPIVDINYGILKNLQLTIASAYVNSGVEDDFDSFEFALKWLFYEGDFFSIAINPKFKSYPVASIFNEGETYELSIPMNFVLCDSLDLVADITYIHPVKYKEHFEFGTYLKYQYFKHGYYLEIFMEESQEDKKFLMLGALGYTYQFHQNVAFMISFGKEVTDNKPKAVIGYSGLQFVF